MDDDLSNPLSYYGQTVINPWALAVTILMGILTITLPRRYALWPMAVIACFIAPAQRIIIANANFTLLRILVVFGWTRLLVRREISMGKWHALDVTMIALSLCYAISYIALRQTLDSLVFTLGETFDALGLYFLCRMLIRSWDDVNSIITGFAILSIPVAVMFIIENRTGHNPFAVLGGVPAITMIREGRLRCQGAFSHPIMAGTFWATLTPLFVSQWWWKNGRKWLIVAGTGSACLIVALCASSGPISAMMVAVLAAFLYPLRRWMRPIRWGILFMLIALHLSMQKPVWHLISRIDWVGGSTGWYRYILIDQAIKHFNEWWALGTVSTSNWGGEGMPLDDITNQYILEGVRGGILTVALFVACVSLAFRCVGYIGRACERSIRGSAQSWALGVALFMHVASFFSVAYFGQTIMVWYLLLGMIASLYVYETKSANPRIVVQTGARRIPTRRARTQMASA